MTAVANEVEASEVSMILSFCHVVQTDRTKRKLDSKRMLTKVFSNPSGAVIGLRESSLSRIRAGMTHK